MTHDQIVFQDGGQFYGPSSLDNGSYICIAEYDWQIPDYDMDGARWARKWFVEVWCIEHNKNPIWE